jgi:1,2-phenylacetyl-CoA epoxidase catalytic subunit
VSDAVLSVDALDDAGRASLRRLILTLADSKRLMGIRYSDWLLGAPSIETGIAASSMAQDEWGHARLLYAMLKDLGIDPVPVEHDRPGEAYASVGSLDDPMPDWAALVAAMVVVDGAIGAVLGSFAEGTFEPARSRVPKMLAEEEFHTSLADAWYRRLAAADQEARSLLVAATEAMLPATLAWVGADDDSARAMVDAGVIGPAAERLNRYRARVAGVLAAAGIDIESTEGVSDWDPERGRTTGRPDEDAVERVRGDRNRSLFVE